MRARRERAPTLKTARKNKNVEAVSSSASKARKQEAVGKEPEWERKRKLLD